MEHPGRVVWLTGLSGAGKTTIAKETARRLTMQNRQFEHLDGDELRGTLCKGLSFTREDRIDNIRRIVFVARLLSRNGIDVVVSAITPYAEMRDNARSQLPGYIEVYVDCPLVECERRDPKGLYAMARKGDLQRFTGISDPYEIPLAPDLTLYPARQSVMECADALMTLLACEA
ncbi:adenylyl-sulfate kinase [Paenibacillus sp. 1P07SE]|uniref:adenylyl-sulfate kinase n=1 Tax=Paenibacillus sp. 1P07SE TaxID=3132209 RepID=UPI0039A43297